MEGHSVIAPDVLARYAVDAAAEVPGVHPTKRGAARVNGDEVEVHLVADFGAVLPTVAADVQRRVRDYLGRMAGVAPSRIDVVVDDVSR